MARYALGRTETFDATTDAAARVQAANRLRTALERDYASTGAAESLVIDLPRGSYVPRFTYRDLTPPTRALSIDPALLEDDAALIVEQFHDGPLEIRTLMRERLVEWLASQPDDRQPRVDG